MDIKQQAINTFQGGLNTDTHPLTTPNSVLTDCINGTIITQNGNEFVLQNDLGNIKLEGSELSPGYIPVGLKEYNGVLYIISYNPLTKRTEVGSYPAPMGSSFDDINQEVIVINGLGTSIEDDQFYVLNPQVLFTNDVTAGDQVAFTSNDNIPSYITIQFFVKDSEGAISNLSTSINKEVSNADYIYIPSTGNLGYYANLPIIKDPLINQASINLISENTMPDTTFKTKTVDVKIGLSYTLDTLYVSSINSVSAKLDISYISRRQEDGEGYSKGDEYTETLSKIVTLNKDLSYVTGNISATIITSETVNSITYNVTPIVEYNNTKNLDSVSIIYNSKKITNTTNIIDNNTVIIPISSMFKYDSKDTGLTIDFDIFLGSRIKDSADKATKIHWTLSEGQIINNTLYTEHKSEGNYNEFIPSEDIPAAYESKKFVDYSINEIGSFKKTLPYNAAAPSTSWEYNKAYIFSVEALYKTVTKVTKTETTAGGEESTITTYEEAIETYKTDKLLFTYKDFNPGNYQDYSKVPLNVWAQNISNYTAVPVIQFNEAGNIKTINNLDSFYLTCLRSSEAQQLELGSDNKYHLPFKNRCAVGVITNTNIEISNYLPSEFNIDDTNNIWYNIPINSTLTFINNKNNTIYVGNNTTQDPNKVIVDITPYDTNYIDLYVDAIDGKAKTTSGKIYDRQYVYDTYSGTRINARKSNKYSTVYNNNVLWFKQDNNAVQLSRGTVANFTGQKQFVDAYLGLYTDIEHKGLSSIKLYKYNDLRYSVGGNISNPFIVNPKVQFLPHLLNIDSNINKTNVVDFISKYKYNTFNYKNSLFSQVLLGPSAPSPYTLIWGNSDSDNTNVQYKTLDCAFVTVKKDDVIKSCGINTRLYSNTVNYETVNHTAEHDISPEWDSVWASAEDKYKMDSVLRFISEHIYTTTNSYIEDNFYVFSVPSTTNGAIKTDVNKVFIINQIDNQETINGINLWGVPSNKLNTIDTSNFTLNFDNVVGSYTYTKSHIVDSSYIYNLSSYNLLTELELAKINRVLLSDSNLLNQSVYTVYNDLEELQVLYDNNQDSIIGYDANELQSFSSIFNNGVMQYIRFDINNNLFYVAVDSSFTDTEKIKFSMSWWKLLIGDCYTNTYIPFPKYYTVPYESQLIPLYGSGNINAISPIFMHTINDIKKIINNE